MTPQEIADLHAQAFAPERGWSEQEFKDLLQSPHVSLFTQTHGFALVQCIAGEAELLSLAVHPLARRTGVASALMQDWMGKVPAKRAFLEVAADNAPAHSLYLQYGFAVTGRRTGYYSRPDGSRTDALMMQAAITPAEAVESPSFP